MQVWSLDNDGDIFMLPSITEKEIKEIEETLQRKLPEAYKEIILKQNGGYIQYSSVQIENASSYLEIDHIKGCGEEGILDSGYLIEEWGLPNDILIFSGDGNHFFALDYRNGTDEPSVIHIDPETEEVTHVASTFNHFLHNLSNEAVSIEDVDFEFEDISLEEAGKIFDGQNAMLIEETLLSFQYTENHQWYFEQLLKCSNHQEQFVRETVMNILDCNLELYIGDSEPNLHSLLKEIVINLTKDNHEDIRTVAKELVEQYY